MYSRFHLKTLNARLNEPPRYMISVIQDDRFCPVLMVSSALNFVIDRGIHSRRLYLYWSRFRVICSLLTKVGILSARWDLIVVTIR
jgi:hypothetical protein